MKYFKFNVVSGLEHLITENNFWKYPIYIYIDGMYAASLNPKYLSLSEIEGLFSGDEETARLVINNYAEALKSVASNIQYLINK